MSPSQPESSSSKSTAKDIYNRFYNFLFIVTSWMSRIVTSIFKSTITDESVFLAVIHNDYIL